MFSRNIRLVCLLLQLCWWSNPVCSQPSEGIAFVYRADTRTPQEVKCEGGFWPRGMSRTHPTALQVDFSLFNHVQGLSASASRDDSGFVSTTASRDSAEEHLLDNMGASGFVYRIHVTENIVNTSASLGPYYQYPDEEEFSAIAGVRWNQVLSWTEYRNGNTVARGPNPDYRPDIFDRRLAGGAQPQLAGFPPGHVAWQEDPWRLLTLCLPGSNIKRHQDSKCVPRESALKVASDYLASVSRFDSLKLQVKLANELFAGTDDTIGARFGPKNGYVSLFHAPSRGQSIIQDVNLTAVFGRTEVSLKMLSTLSLVQSPVPHPLVADDFKVQGTVHAGGCLHVEGWILKAARIDLILPTLGIVVSIHHVESGLKLRNTGYISLDKWMGSRGAMPSIVWSGPLKLEDWLHTSNESAAGETCAAVR